MFVTQSPDDYLSAREISLKNALTMDLNQLFRFVQAFSICGKLVESFDNILLVTADRYRSKCKPSDRSTNAVFKYGNNNYE